MPPQHGKGSTENETETVAYIASRILGGSRRSVVLLIDNFVSERDNAFVIEIIEVIWPSTQRHRQVSHGLGSCPSNIAVGWRSGQWNLLSIERIPQPARPRLEMMITPARDLDRRGITNWRREGGSGETRRAGRGVLGTTCDSTGATKSPATMHGFAPSWSVPANRSGIWIFLSPHTRYPNDLTLVTNKFLHSWNAPGLKGGGVGLIYSYHGEL